MGPSFFLLSFDAVPVGTLDRADMADNVRIRAFETDLCDARFTCVVRRGDQAQVAEFLYQEGQVRDAALNVFLDAEAVPDAKTIGSRGHQLHETGSALIRHCVRLPSRFDIDNCCDEL